MWKEEKTGEIFVVTSLYKEVLSSYAVLRSTNPAAAVPSRKAKIIKDITGENLVGFMEAEQV
jgi:hypothetical protein